MVFIKHGDLKFISTLHNKSSCQSTVCAKFSIRKMLSAGLTLLGICISEAQGESLPSASSKKREVNSIKITKEKFLTWLVNVGKHSWEFKREMWDVLNYSQKAGLNLFETITFWGPQVIVYFYVSWLKEPDQKMVLQWATRQPSQRCEMLFLAWVWKETIFVYDRLQGSLPMDS